MLVPEDRYDERHYLVDAAKALLAYWDSERRYYWPEYHGVRLRWWQEMAPVLWGIVGIALALGVCWMISRQGYQVAPTHTPGTFPQFVVPTTSP